jgi:multidrug efflux pump subunit AcrA (membrane-fusion protein)
MEKLKPIVKTWLPSLLMMLLLGGGVGIAIQANAVLRAEEEKKKREEEAAKASGKPKVIYTCSMDPQIRWDHPGQCPICSMDLIPVSGEAGIAITLEPRYLQLAGILTAPVLHRALRREIRTVGVFEPDETRRKTVPAWVGGRLDRLFVAYTGQKVEVGEPLAIMYSQELLRSREELLLALSEVARAKEEKLGPRETGRVAAALEAARSRLLRLGLTAEQVQRMEAEGNPVPGIEIPAPTGGTVLHKNVEEGDYVHPGHVLFHIADLSVLWFVLDVYENELTSLRVGQEVYFEPGAYPGERVRGFITFIDPVVDPRKRTVRVRVPVDNSHGRFKPGMFAKARILVDLGPDGEPLTPSLGTHACPRHPEIVAGEGGTCPLDGEELVTRSVPDLPPAPYACSMECDHFEHAGPCPVCGMKMAPLPPGVEERRSHICLLHLGEESREGGDCPVDGTPMVPYVRRVGRALAIPREALITLGTRHFVYEKVGQGKFEPREISVGPMTGRYAPLLMVPRTGQFYPHLQTVRRGDSIVVGGAYYLDSQLQLQGKLSIFSPTLPALEALAPAERFLAAYFQAGRALARDRFDRGPHHFETMRAALGKVLEVKAPAMSHGEKPTLELQAHFRHMAPALEAAEPSSMAGARKGLAALGKGMRMYVEEVHPGIYGGVKLHLFEDPETGHVWVQDDEDPAHPFRGKAGVKFARKIELGGGASDEKASQGSGSKGGGHAHH